MEIWKDIEGYEGRYQVSNKGNVKSLRYHRGKGERVLAKCLDTDGYSIVLLYKGGKRRTSKVHQLVASAFLVNSENLPSINHKDKNKQNNAVENLEYCTVGYNNCYSKNIPVLQMDMDGRVIKEWDSLKEASDCLKVKLSNISACCRHYGKHKTAGGFTWAYKV